MFSKLFHYLSNVSINLIGFILKIKSPSASASVFVALDAKRTEVASGIVPTVPISKTVPSSAEISYKKEVLCLPLLHY